MECREIGKLEDGSPDPCLDCGNIDKDISDVECCQICVGYDQYVKPIKEQS